MTLPITDNLKYSLKLPSITPTLVVKIDGVSKIFGNVEIKKYIKIGDPDLLIGDDWTIGGFNLVDNQSPYITFNTGTTTKISQKLDPSRGLGSSVSKMSIVLIDVNQEALNLISPGFQVDDMIGRFCTVYLGVLDTSWPEDYNVVFKGIVEAHDVAANTVTLYLSSTEDKKRASALSKQTAKTTSSTSNVAAAIDLDDASGLLTPVDVMGTFLKINNELIEYTGKSSNQLTGVTRGKLNTTAATHASGSDVEQVIRLTDVGINLALKIMLSGGPEWYASGVPVTSFVYYDPSTQVDNTVFFEGLDLIGDHGIAQGDTVEFLTAVNNGNEIVTTIAEVGKYDNGSYIVVNDTLIPEGASTATARFKTPFNVLPFGLKMLPREIDVAQHLYVRDTFLPARELDIYVKDIEVGKSFIEEIYIALACYSVPRKGTSSVVYHVGPLPSDDILILDETNVENPESLIVKRSLSENFFNQIIFNYDSSPVDNSFKKTKIFNSDYTTITDKIGERPFTINSQGVRTTQDGDLVAESSANRYLQRYERGAEYIRGVRVFFGEGYRLEIGDIVVVDFTALKLGDVQTASREGGLKLMEIVNKTLDNKTGEVSIDLINSVFLVSERYGLISPASLVTTGSTTTKLKVNKSYGTRPWERESNKWKGYEGQSIQVRSEDFSTIYTTIFRGFDNGSPQAMLVDAIPAPPASGWIIEAVDYPSSTDPEIQAFWKLRHAFWSPQVLVTNAVSLGQSIFEVDSGDISKFKVGAPVRIHNYTYSEDGGDALVTDVDTGTNQVTIDTPTGFNIGTDHYIDLIGFADGGGPYRLV